MASQDINMKHIQTFESFLNESFSAADTVKAAELISSKIGAEPGYFFFGNEDQIKQFNSFWNRKMYRQAVNMLMGIDNLKDLLEYIEQNEGREYFKGISKSTEDKKKAQMAKQAAMSDDDPDAYKEMPGDTKGKKLQKTSKHTKKYHELYGNK
jgi:hypothetical protein